MAGMINCPFCGKLTDPKLEHCPHCRGYLKREAEAPSGKKPARKPGQTCPNCGALVQDGDIICVACGTNLLTGQKIAEETRKPAVRPRRKISPLVMGGVGVLLLVALAVAATLYFALTRDPVQQALDLARGKDFLAASGILNEHLSKHADDAQAHFLLGKVYWQTNQYLNAADEFGKAAKLDKANTEAGLMGIASLASVTSQDTMPQQTAILRDLVSAAPDNVQVQYLLALAYGIQGKVEEQIAALKKVVELKPNDGGAQQQLGVALALNKAYVEAEKALAEAQRLGANPADTVAALGLVSYLQGDLGSASARLTAALGLDEKGNIRTQAMTRLGLLLASQGKLSEAMPYLKEVSRGDQGMRAAKFFYAVALAAQGGTVEALQEFETLGQNNGPLAVEANIQAANLYLAQNDQEHAQQAVGRAASFGGASAALETMRGRVQAAGRDFRQALASFKQAIQLDASYAPAHLEYGLSLIRRETFDEGVRELEEYLRLVRPEDPGTRTEEVASLVEQLKETLGKETTATAPEGRS